MICYDRSIKAEARLGAEQIDNKNGRSKRKRPFVYLVDIWSFIKAPEEGLEPPTR